MRAIVKRTGVFVAAALLFAAQAGAGLAAGKGSAGKAESLRRDADVITYSTFRPGNWDVYYFASRGAEPKRLTDDVGLDYDAVFSPDGRWVVYCSERRGSPDLYALDLKGGGAPRLLIEDESLEDQAAFSPDGKTLAFVSDRDGSADVFVIPFEPNKTQSMKKAVNLTHHEGGEFRPAFSPDGKSIAFSTDWDTAPTGPAARVGTWTCCPSASSIWGCWHDYCFVKGTLLKRVLRDRL